MKRLKSKSTSENFNVNVLQWDLEPHQVREVGDGRIVLVCDELEIDGRQENRERELETVLNGGNTHREGRQW